MLYCGFEVVNPGLLRVVIIALAPEHDTLDKRRIQIRRHRGCPADASCDNIHSEDSLSKRLYKTADSIAHSGLRDHGALTATCICQRLKPRDSAGALHGVRYFLTCPSP
jgi:hypothetical protein